MYCDCKTVVVIVAAPVVVVGVVIAAGIMAVFVAMIVYVIGDINLVFARAGNFLAELLAVI